MYVSNDVRCHVPDDDDVKRYRQLDITNITSRQQKDDDQDARQRIPSGIHRYLYFDAMPFCRRRRRRVRRFDRDRSEIDKRIEK